MLSFLKALRARLSGGSDASPSVEAREAVEYKGYSIQPAPYSSAGQFQTAGVIQKTFPDGPKEHRFVRAETHASKDDAAAFAIRKAQQIIDEQGDRIFGGPR
jgi:hypothetical protein